MDAFNGFPGCSSAAAPMQYGPTPMMFGHLNAGYPMAPSTVYGGGPSVAFQPSLRQPQHHQPMAASSAAAPSSTSPLKQSSGRANTAASVTGSGKLHHPHNGSNPCFSKKCVVCVYELQTGLVREAYKTELERWARRTKRASAAATSHAEYVHSQPPAACSRPCDTIKAATCSFGS